MPTEPDKPSIPTPIAIVGMALRVPGAVTPQRFWRNMLDGRDCLTRFSAEELRRAGVSRERLSHPDYVRVSPVLEDIEYFDAAFFDMPGVEAERTDPSHRLFLECVWESLEGAGIVPGRNGEVTGVFGGCEGHYRSKVLDCVDNMDDPGIGIPLRLGNDLDFFTARVSHKLDLVGPSFTVMAACATSLLAVHLAVQSLRRGECRVAVAGGASVDVPHIHGYLAGVEGMLSAAGRIRPFDAGADGTIFGSGVGVVVLKPLDDALADRNPIYAVIRGSACTNDGNPPGKESFIAPSPKGQIAAIAGALTDSRVSPETIGYVEAHGTGTLLGDPVEVASLTDVYRRETAAREYCALGSVKANVGHLRTAAGVVSLIKASLALSHRTLPPLGNFERPNPGIDFRSSPFFVSANPHPWSEPPQPRRAGVSAFGFGGSNVHVILEEHEEKPASESLRRQHLFPLSAGSGRALSRRIIDLGAHLEQHDNLPLADVAHTLQRGRKALAHRACFSVDEDRFSPKDLFYTKAGATGIAGTGNRSPVFLFPGQGSQRPGMGRTLYARERLYRDTVDECAERLEAELGFDIRTLIHGQGSEAHADIAEALRRTANAQPALFVVEYATARLFMSWGVTPVAMLGHSIGELVAACLADVFCLGDGLRLVASRAKLMQQCEPGSMVAVFMAPPYLEGLLPDRVELAAVNAPAISVVSGPAAAVERFTRELQQKGVGAWRLETSHAFHSWMMEPALPEFAALLSDIRLNAPKIPVVSNTTGLPLSEEQAVDPGYWSDHIRRGVRFWDGVQYLVRYDNPVFIEVGPGRMLCDLIRQHGSDLEAVPTLEGKFDRSDADEQRNMLDALGRIWCVGVDVDWPRFYGAEKRRLLSLPTYPFQKFRYWQDRDDDGAIPDSSKPLYETGWREAPVDAADFRGAERPWLIFRDDRGLGEALIEKLKGEAANVMSVVPGELFEQVDGSTFRVRPGSREDLLRVLESIVATNGDYAPRVLHLWCVTGSSGLHNSVQAFKRSSEYGFFTLLALIQAAFDRGVCDSLDVLAVADCLAPMDGEEGPLHAEKAALLGLCRDVPLEIPGLSMRCADVPSLDDTAVPSWLADAVLKEARLRDEPRLAALRPDKRFVEQLYVLPSLPLSKPKLREGGTVLITGGMGGLGLTFAAALFDLCRARLVLTSRWQPPPAEQWPERALRDDKIGLALRQVLELKARGAQVLIVKADAADPASLAGAVAEAQSRFGPIHGVVHAAGISEAAPALYKTRSSAERVFAPKIHGAFNLDEIFAQSPLDFFSLSHRRLPKSRYPARSTTRRRTRFSTRWPRAERRTPVA